MPGNAVRTSAPVASEKTASGRSISSQMSQASAVSPPEMPISADIVRGVGRLLVDGEGFERGDQLLVVADDGNAVALDEALEGVVVADQGAGMGQRRPRTDGGPADLEHDQRLAGGMDAVDRVGEAVGVRDEFEHQADHRRVVVGGEPAQIIRAGDPVLAADGDDLGEAGRAGIDHRDRRRARLGDQRDRTAGGRAR